MLFQSTLPRGERRMCAWWAAREKTFQSTLPRGERRRRADYSNDWPGISIHAPAWGATSIKLINPYIPGYFNPRSRVGSDDTQRRDLTEHLQFQSTLPRGERPVRGWHPGRAGNKFQSTLPRGERPAGQQGDAGTCIISIHAPAWGATLTKSIR